MRAIITVGLGFGDEGKGATVDFLTRKYHAQVVVRYSGGSQAGHNVQLPDGSRHTFSQFGAGTLAGAKTYLGPRMIISPGTMPPEAEHLKTLGVANPMSLLTAHPECLVSSIYHMLMNRLREVARGKDRHGSCGLGIGETRHYWLRYGQDAIVAGDLTDADILKSKLRLLRDRFLQEMQDLGVLDEAFSQALHETRPAEEADALQESSDGMLFFPQIPVAETIVFEGAQGVLLDEWHGFHPYTTWSTVTAEPAWELIDEHGIEDVTVLGVTRAYTTRHGAGPFPTFDPECTARIIDLGNPVNDWQGAIRSGPLDFPLLNYALSARPVDGLVVNHLDQVPPMIPIAMAYESPFKPNRPRTLREQEALTNHLKVAKPIITNVSQTELLERLNELAPVVITANGPMHLHRRFAGNQTVLKPPEQTTL